MLSRLGIPAVLLLAFLAVARGRARWSPGDLEITFFDVGQGDSALLRFPRGTAWLVDAGGGFADWDMGSRELVPELARHGILKLDVAFLTHPDQDHGYGFLGILKELEVGALWWNAAALKKPKPLLAQLRAQAKARGFTERSFTAPTRLEIEGVSAEVIPLDSGPGRNDRPLALRVSFAGCSALFPADSELAAETDLARRVDSVDLLKVAHHGSRTSSNTGFLNATDPRWAVVSSGVLNRYGHPHPSVLQRLAKFHATVLRTDFHGFVRFTFSREGRARCESAVGPCGESICRGSDQRIRPRPLE